MIILYQTIEELENAGYKYHHTALFRGYVSRKIDYQILPYEGRFGVGYKVLKPNPNSHNYSWVEYYVK